MSASMADDFLEFLKEKERKNKECKSNMSQKTFEDALKHVSITITGDNFSEAVGAVMVKMAKTGDLGNVLKAAVIGSMIMNELFHDKIKNYVEQMEGEI